MKSFEDSHCERRADSVVPLVTLFARIQRSSTILCTSSRLVVTAELASALCAWALRLRCVRVAAASLPQLAAPHKSRCHQSVR